MYFSKTISNFFENSWRYSHVKVHHQYQRHRWQIAIGINVTSGKLPPVSMTPVANFSTIFASVVGTGGNCINDTGVNDPSDKP
jgi:hypothetical protein